ncbi:unnamed protein product [Fusarium graminearum]|nr:unnamed protein product [Fusarium graminearum]
MSVIIQEFRLPSPSISKSGFKYIPYQGCALEQLEIHSYSMRYVLERQATMSIKHSRSSRY